jgi:hypothetical protein
LINFPKRTKTDEKYEALKRNPRNVWIVARRFYFDQMLPILKFIENPRQVPELQKVVLERYLLVCCVSLIEKFMAIKIKKAIDEEDIDISSFDSRNSYEELIMKYPKMTKGHCVVIQKDFTSGFIIDKIATRVLKSDTRFSALDMNFIMQ